MLSLGYRKWNTGGRYQTYQIKRGVQMGCKMVSRKEEITAKDTDWPSEPIL